MSNVQPLFGSHLSIAGGYHKAARAAGALRMATVQIFTKNNNQWRAKELTEPEVTCFREACREHGLVSPCSHASYLINLASPNEELWLKSIEAFVIELERASALGLVGVVVHPGSFVDSSEETGLARIVEAVDQCLAQTAELPVEIWLETTAGQGSNLGWRFEHLQQIIAQARDARRLGVCVDTCHIFAAGYPLATPKEYKATMAQLERTVGLDRVRAFHLNDSKRELGSRVDRHEHIGEGCLGLEPFRHLLRDPRFADRPMYLETPKGLRDGQELDALNLAVLRDLLPKRGPWARR